MPAQFLQICRHFFILSKMQNCLIFKVFGLIFKVFMRNFVFTFAMDNKVNISGHTIKA